MSVWWTVSLLRSVSGSMLSMCVRVCHWCSFSMLGQPGIVAVCFVESLGCCVGCSVSLACECVAVGAVFNDLFGGCLEGALMSGTSTSWPLPDRLRSVSARIVANTACMPAMLSTGPRGTSGGRLGGRFGLRVR